MTADQFTYWLQGFAELNAAPPSDEQWQSIREHLALVFTKVTSCVGQPLGGGIAYNRLAQQNLEDALRSTHCQTLC